ncbi:MAG: PA domain-containing protein, partial [Pseudobdellovibrionaceae bacterium]
MRRQSQLQWKVLFSILLISSSSALAAEDPGLIQNMRQLTFVGPRSGEGYFSADGKKMIFQSERTDGNPFYQIFLMDLESGKTTQISPGKGKTTCSWIRPDQKRVLFASTHLDPALAQKTKEEYESRKSPQKNKYSWSFDETFDLFETDLNGKNSKRLTKEKGYDAEGSYSPDGKWIAFASNRAAYTEKLSEEEQKIFNQDPSYMMDLYIMKADGSQVRRLTKARGYDGGPFFSADGTKITWRRFAPNGQSAEVFTMNVDGSDEKQLTSIKAMSWAPFFHPSGDYLIFTTNVLGFSNFELYLVDAKGEKPPLRVSFLDGFDGLPVFTPDGQHLSWTRRNEKGESQIYMATWDDAKARELLGLPIRAPKMQTLASREINEQDAKAWVQYLASPALGGRATGSAEEKEYTAKIAEAFQALGLVPAEGKDFLFPFTFTSGVSLGEKNTLKFQEAGKENSFQISNDFVPVSFSKVGEFAAAPVVFAGYGITAPAADSQAAYDSYKDLDVKGKWVLIFRELPEGIPADRRIYLNRYSRLHHKALIAKQAGALGLLVVNGPNSSSQKLIKLKYEGGFAESGIPILSISDAVAEKLVKS